MSDDIEIPVIEICDGWTVDDIETEDDCDDAFALLTKIIARIEEHLDILEANEKKQDIQYIKTKTALRYKRAALNIVNTKRGRLKREQTLSKHSLIIGYLATYHKDILDQAELYLRVQDYAKKKVDA
jgi:hypothetical protein